MGHRSWFTPIKTKLDFEVAIKILDAVEASNNDWEEDADWEDTAVETVYPDPFIFDYGPGFAYLLHLGKVFGPWEKDDWLLTWSSDGSGIMNWLPYEISAKTLMFEDCPWAFIRNGSIKNIITFGEFETELALARECLVMNLKLLDGLPV